MNEHKDHIPVLTKEVLQYLDLKPDENVIDGTVGNGGHANLMLEKTSPFGKLLGIDADRDQITNARRNAHAFNERIVLVNDSYANIKEIAERVRFKPINAILLDLGYSSWHIAQSQKGFSFLKNEPLDMRYGGGELTAGNIINEYKEKELEKILREYGEEKFSKQIAMAIVRQRRVKKIESTFDLVSVIEEVVGARYQREKIHCATRTFQALRIAVNGELDNLQTALPQALEVLAPGGRLAVISFHSLEDRIVKHFFQQEGQKGTVIILTKKPVEASDSEISENPRSRSAKLRAIIKR
ncbi:MAG TPA: 16S rRNA (cytosine(1402)-N(4))-methyltransferase RsmH [Negativicutes bacterium]|uniref:Ribosomal RNA small subunit methyltransferase H n=1 Tax=Candidatus Staskawiczbacteria bacterium RIFCSPHIGHO2_01_FULL_41_41 TaxID=1802203 RepID=A0A1G2HVM9_9BACT|nr:MAG: 16S rRNA (cytosine(1402)-N(4))-methyltransferase [Candidatus Staskawiczbacteria bacterium RIFCSPHIGHO2_01_FULL_41_41]OGZ69143.1 MAG: 16S rRNA (cytosine(1402)-N(4))-methyltransferase [Candidatus Staskawiczbacteria bacterium RIFCSPHIGHO2_02_FULL_43_16]OGZ74428.1 MAG: 16S rRNA (cytosine(1402)-N(4))-methyltransferase [Candidatus Staskawiczbacteria bacterium RIFCSPLOWO2_01_FULL_43_17b]HLD70713.1 16S rRNA (cytosine(1402)-N(4))-methyltransferase RsmH [Negativicutes bacterium]